MNAVKNLPFYIVDVFAEEKYTGNQLAVFRKAEALKADEMQKIAREMNFSESTFIRTDEMRDGGFDVRIFTPEQEIPFAGHPTLGTAYIIRREILNGAADEVRLNLQAGQIPVAFGSEEVAWMRQLPPVFGATHSCETMADILGLSVDQIDGRFPVQEVSTGLAFFIVALKSLSALKRAVVDRARYFDFIKQTEAKAILIFCPETYCPDNDISVRVFVDCYGIPEDPATGSANGCLAGYLVKHAYFGQGKVDIRVEQGIDMGRPSLLLLQAVQGENGIQVAVGGKSILIARGEWV